MNCSQLHHHANRDPAQCVDIDQKKNGRLAITLPTSQYTEYWMARSMCSVLLRGGVYVTTTPFVKTETPEILEAAPRELDFHDASMECSISIIETFLDRKIPSLVLDSTLCCVRDCSIRKSKSPGYCSDTENNNTWSDLLMEFVLTSLY
ncbi:hypothetical protein BCON_0231g00040 [Botryotinia convoluta]|uniref:Uncharacterized protein n=1 Tax=Botryotinia convoluta TaxID=54673 RepID=A0A4Z1HN54_9HELO|nr:hypothetical protein BCON_0231g00040 [Botryotinia convoluta]